MSLPPRAPLNVAILDAYDRLGLKGGFLPSLLENLTPVLILGDLSAQALARPTIEARKYCQFFHPAGVGATWGSRQLQVISGGGAIVESLEVGTGDLGGIGSEPRTIGLVIGPDTTAGAKLTGATDEVDVGGLATVSFLVRINSTVDPSAGSPPMTSVVCNREVTPPSGVKFWWGATTGPIFVRNSEFFTIFNRAQNVSLIGHMVWRELPGPEGTL